MNGARQTRRPACWPDAAEELLLAAVIRDDGAAIDSWRRWRSIADSQPVPPESRRLLPWVFRRLARLDFRDDAYTGLKAEYRKTWSRNHFLFSRAGSAVAELEGAGIETLVLKGGAIAHLDYGDVGARPMADVDVLVRRERAQEATALLLDLGWETGLASPSATFGVLHAQNLRHETGGIDLHWHALMRRQPDDDLWDRTVPLSLGSGRTAAPDAASRLLHVCVHGAEAGDPPPIHWVADAAVIVAGGQVDWEALVERARRRQVTLILAETLGYLRRRFDVQVPGGALDELRASPRSRFERAAWRAAVRPRTIRNVVAQEWFRYRRVASGRSWPGFARYLQVSMGYERPRELAGHVVARLRRGPTR